MDIEGIDLCRDGEVCIIQIGTSAGKVYLFDIVKLGQDAFNRGGLRTFLHSDRTMKVIYDGRSDSDALWHQFQTNIVQAYDLQVLFMTAFGDPCDRYLKGLKKCLEVANVIPPEKRAHMEQVKTNGLALFAPERGGSYDVWKARPMDKRLIRYAASDVSYLLSVRAKWQHHKDEEFVMRTTATRIDQAVRHHTRSKGPQKKYRDF